MKDLEWAIAMGSGQWAMGGNAQWAVGGNVQWAIQRNSNGILKDFERF